VIEKSGSNICMSQSVFLFFQDLPKMMKTMNLTDLNPNIICVLCRGYLIDPVTVVECVHSCEFFIHSFIHSSIHSLFVCLFVRFFLSFSFFLLSFINEHKIISFLFFSSFSLPFFPFFSFPSHPFSYFVFSFISFSTFHSQNTNNASSEGEK